MDTMLCERSTGKKPKTVCQNIDTIQILNWTIRWAHVSGHPPLLLQKTYFDDFGEYLAGFTALWSVERLHTDPKTAPGKSSAFTLTQRLWGKHQEKKLMTADDL